MHAVFAAVIESLVHRPTTVDVYVRADEFNFKVLHLSSPHDKGKLVTYNMKLLHKCHFGTCHRPIDCQNQNYTAPRAQTSGRPECLPKVMWYSNLDFRINPDSDPDVRQITAKMLWIYYLVSISHFAESHENRPVTVWEMQTNLKSRSVSQVSLKLGSCKSHVYRHQTNTGEAIIVMCITNCWKIFSFQFASFCDSYYIYFFRDQPKPGSENGSLFSARNRNENETATLFLAED